MTTENTVVAGTPATTDPHTATGWGDVDVAQAERISHVNATAGGAAAIRPTGLVVTVYTTGPACQACRMTKKRLDQHGIAYTEVPIHNDDREAIDYLEFRTAPVVCVSSPAGDTAWDGYRPDHIDALQGAA